MLMWRNQGTRWELTWVRSGSHGVHQFTFSVCSSRNWGSGCYRTLFELGKVTGIDTAKIINSADSKTPGWLPAQPLHKSSLTEPLAMTAFPRTQNVKDQQYHEQSIKCSEPANRSLRIHQWVGCYCSLSGICKIPKPTWSQLENVIFGRTSGKKIFEIPGLC